MDLELGGHVAVITGGASGIGLACARGLAREGCRVALWDLAPNASQVATALGEECSVATFGLTVNVKDYRAIRAAVAGAAP